MTSLQSESNNTTSRTFHTTDWRPLCAVWKVLRRPSFSVSLTIFYLSFPKKFLHCRLHLSCNDGFIFFATVFRRTTYMFNNCFIVCRAGIFPKLWLAFIILQQFPCQHRSVIVCNPFLPSPMTGRRRRLMRLLGSPLMEPRRDSIWSSKSYSFSTSAMFQFQLVVYDTSLGLHF